MNLAFLRYNNYYNRQIKRENSLSDYIPYILGDIMGKIAFNPNDGVITEQIVNWNYKGQPDYMLAIDDNDINSRWFVLEFTRTRAGQYRVILKRDVVADYYEPLLTAPMFIEKATISQLDPMIYNREDMTFNQIKKSETLLKDETKCPWLVAYLATTDAENNTKVYEATANTGGIESQFIVSGLQNWEYYKYTQDAAPYAVDTYNYYATVKLSRIDATRFYNFKTVGKQDYSSSQIENLGTPIPHPDSIGYIKDSLEFVFNKWYSPGMAAQINTLNSFANNEFTFINSAESQILNNLNGKILEDTSVSPSKYYKINLTYQFKNLNKQITAGALYNKWVEIVDNSGFTITPNKGLNITLKCLSLGIDLEEILDYTGTINIGATRYHLNDAPYDMICMPYSNDLKIYKNGAQILTANKELAFNTMMSLSRKYGGESAKFLYDVQLLPYCPVRELIQSDNTVDVRDDDRIVSYIKNNNEENIGAIFIAKSSSFTLNIPFNIPITNTKIQNLTDMHRLCSPNYNGVFEFSAAKNGGVEFINVDCTYKPYDPYIHANPNFKNLYGADFNDSRGLVVGGDFSLPQTTSAWESYQLANKNYQAVFDRQIQNLEVNNAVQRERDIWSAAGGAATGVVSGAMAGSAAGPWGAVAGAVVGGVASVAGGIRDYQLNETLRRETIDYTKDQFGYSLGNIQALPTGLAKTSAFTANNKIYPFIEYYTCTDEEKRALENKLKYNGMTVMRIGQIQEFLQEDESYIKGKLIRLEDISEEYHLVEEIAKELNKGVFIK